MSLKDFFLPDDSVIYINGKAADYENCILAKPSWGTPDRKTKCDVFVLMPFADEFKPIYKDHIKKICSEMGLICKRADDIFMSGSIMQSI